MTPAAPLAAIHPAPAGGTIDARLFNAMLAEAIDDYEAYRFTADHLAAERHLARMLNRLTSPWAERNGYRYELVAGELERKPWRYGRFSGGYREQNSRRTYAFVSREAVEMVFAFADEEVDL